MPLSKGRHLLIPSNLVGKDFSSLIPGEKNIQDKADSILLFLHYIAVRSRAGKQEEEKPATDRGYVQVHRDIRRTILGKRYQQIIDRLIMLKIIQVMAYRQNPFCSNADELVAEPLEYYKPGKSCKQYRLYGSSDNQLVYIPVSDKPHLLQKLEKLKGPIKTESDQLRDKLKHNAGLIRYKESEEAVADMQQYLDSIGETGTTLQNEIMKMNCGDSDAEFDDFGFRLHAHHTRLKKNLRKHLYFIGYENKPLVEIDFRSSQPFLFSNISASLIKELVPECKEAIPILEKYEKDRQHRKNMKLFRQLCQKAEIYPFFKQKFKEEFNIDIQDGEAKQVFCRGFFCDYTMAPGLNKEKDRILTKSLPLHHPNGKLNSNFTLLSLWIIRKYFPAIFNINKELKALDWQHLVPGMNDYKQYANNCLLAQRIESAIILERISKELVSKEIVFTTIHDSFLVHKNNLWEVKRIIKANFEKLGIKPPKLSVKKLAG